MRMQSWTGGYCKHVAAVLYTLLDFYHIDLKESPLDVACNEVGQRWNIPSAADKPSSRAFRFDDLLRKQMLGNLSQQPFLLIQL